MSTEEEFTKTSANMHTVQRLTPRLLVALSLSTLFGAALSCSLIDPVDPYSPPTTGGASGSVGDSGEAGISGPPAHCSDKKVSGDESDVDCGGSCGSCEVGFECNTKADCKTASCDRICLAAGCTDKAKNGNETDLDCGGPNCSSCSAGQQCLVNSDCESAVCDKGSCSAASCTDNTVNQDETDIDCGGTSCTTSCDIDKKCLTSKDCESGYCSLSSMTCTTAACVDTIKNGSETDVDCGGSCPSCDTGKSCLIGDDCASKSCVDNAGSKQCAAPSCSDGIQNGTETDVDCGPGCSNQCGTGKKCTGASDCASGICAADSFGQLLCQAASCSDMIKNQDESDTDCGGVCGSNCSIPQACGTGADCLSGNCKSKKCDVGLTTAASCKVAADCLSYSCSGTKKCGDPEITALTLFNSLVGHGKTNNSIEASLRLQNTGSASANWSDIRVNYYYSNQNSVELNGTGIQWRLLNGEFDYLESGTSRTAKNFTSSTGTTYQVFVVTWPAITTSLSSGAIYPPNDYFDFQIQTNYSQNESDDYSFADTTTATPNSKVVVERKSSTGKWYRVWGSFPN